MDTNMFQDKWCASLFTIFFNSYVFIRTLILYAAFLAIFEYFHFRQVILFAMHSSQLIMMFYILFIKLSKVHFFNTVFRDYRNISSCTYTTQHKVVSPPSVSLTQSTLSSVSSSTNCLVVYGMFSKSRQRKLHFDCIQ